MPKAERLEDLPPKIQELLKKRGWTYPPTEEMKREWREAAKQFDGALRTPLEVLEELAQEDHVLYAILQRRKERGKRQGCEDAR